MYRHEYKYYAKEDVLSALEQRMQTILSHDSHVEQNGSYQVRSLYFDNMYNSCYRDIEAGTDPREKFRIRIYGSSSSVINLELKRKQHGLTEKLSCPLSAERCKRILDGKIPDFKNDDSQLYKHFWVAMQSLMLRPACIVTYDRTPYIWQQRGKIISACNVRVTFDRNIRSSSDFSRFFDKTPPSRLVLQTGSNLMEVKYNSFLPDFIYESLQTNKLRETNFSKYYLCRKFNMTGKKIA